MSPWLHGMDESAGEMVQVRVCYGTDECWGNCVKMTMNGAEQLSVVN